MIDSEASIPHVRVARNAALSLVAIFLLGGSRLLYTIIVGRKFGTIALGEVTLAINAAMFASLLISGGWQASTAKYLAQALGRGAPREADAIYRRTLFHNTTGGIVVALLLAIALIKIPGLTLSRSDAIFASAILLTYNGYQHAKAAMYGFGEVKSYLALEIVGSGALIAGLAVVALMNAPRWLLAPVAASYALFTALSLVRRRPKHAGAIDAPLWNEMRSFTLLAVIGTIASAGFLNLSPVFAGHYDSRVAVGRFGAAIALVIPIYFVPRALSLALFPSIAFRHGQQRGDSVRRQLEVSGRSLLIVLCAPTVVAAVMARGLLHFLYGASFQGGADILAIMLAATYLSVVQVPFVTTLSGTEKRWFKIPVLASVGGFALGLVLWVILGRAYGATGVAWGYLIGSIPQCVIPVWFAAREFKVAVLGISLRAALVWGLAGASRAVLGSHPPIARSAVAAAVVLLAFALLFAADLRRMLGDARAHKRAAE